MKRRLLLSVLIVIAGLAVIRAIVPFGVQWYVNNTLARAENYSGHVGDIDLSLWRGAYQIEAIDIVKNQGTVTLPLFSAERVEFSVLWSALFRGAVVGEVDLLKPEINFIDSDTEEKKQTGESENWLSIANDLFPLRIDKLVIRQGQIAFHNLDADPNIHIATRNIELNAYNLATNDLIANDQLAIVFAQGNTMDKGSLSVSATVNPHRKKPTFDVNVEAQDVALKDYENFLNYYAPFDLEAGTLEFALELASDDGEVKGYLKPVLNDVEVFSWKGDVEEDEDGILAILGEILAGAFAEIFENQPRDQLATNIPINGDIDNVSSDNVKAFLGVLRNAFVDAIEAKLDDTISLDKDER
jgi:uncharacterized protein involved in outer membrane biogenesis